MPSELTPTKSRLEVVRRAATLGCETSPGAGRHPVSPGVKSLGATGVGRGVGLGVAKGVGLGVLLCLGVGLGVGASTGVGVGVSVVGTATMSGAGLEYLPVSGVAAAARPEAQSSPHSPHGIL